jgi:hypothetical protein
MSKAGASHTEIPFDTQLITAQTALMVVLTTLCALVKDSEDVEHNRAALLGAPEAKRYLDLQEQITAIEDKLPSPCCSISVLKTRAMLSWWRHHYAVDPDFGHFWCLDELFAPGRKVVKTRQALDSASRLSDAVLELFAVDVPTGKRFGPSFMDHVKAWETASIEFYGDRDDDDILDRAFDEMCAARDSIKAYPKPSFTEGLALLAALRRDWRRNGAYSFKDGRVGEGREAEELKIHDFELFEKVCDALGAA